MFNSVNLQNPTLIPNEKKRDKARHRCVFARLPPTSYSPSLPRVPSNPSTPTPTHQAYMFRRSLASSSSSLLRSSSSLLSVVARPLVMSSTVTLSARASLFQPTCSGSIRCKSSTYELASEGKSTHVKDLKRDWAEKGPVAFEEMKDISKRASSSTVSFDFPFLPSPPPHLLFRTLLFVVYKTNRI